MMQRGSLETVVLPSPAAPILDRILTDDSE
jgi:hypothetical protein